MPFRVELIEAVASPNLPAGKGILALRHAHPAQQTRLIGASGLSANNVRHLTDGNYKVMDFGFARHTLRSGITVAGQPGTPGFASPEHLHPYSGAPTAASDVFCTGILMYAALTGQLPIPWRGDEADYVRRLLAVQIAPVTSIRRDLTPPQAQLVMRCLHRQPARRYLNGNKLAAAIEEMA